MAVGMAYLSRYLSTACNTVLYILTKKYKLKFVSKLRNLIF